MTLTLHSGFQPSGAAGRGGGRPDLQRAARAAEAFLDALGVDCNTPSMARSPRRMAEAYAELLTARDFNLTTFANDEGYDELVLVKAIPVQSGVSTTCCPSSGWRTWPTCPLTRSWDCPRSLGWWRCSPAGHRSRSG